MEKTAAELRQQAADCRQRSAESWERSDTDGFLSQWASDLSARLYESQASILENGGLSTFWGLYDSEKNRIPAKMINGQFGNVWLLRDDAAAKLGRRFIPVSYEGRSTVQKKLGLCEIEEQAPARADITGKGHGLSGSAWVAHFRTGDEWGLDSKVIE